MIISIYRSIYKAYIHLRQKLKSFYTVKETMNIIKKQAGGVKVVYRGGQELIELGLTIR